ncbi:MAG: DHA2 family efflux MFS transporter permease subunit, partial [Anaeromyxobacteraceae bacterium]
MADGLALRSPRGRGVLVATVLASGMAFLDGTVVNVALPTLGRELGASMSGLQWVVDAYLLTLSALLLLGGSLGDVLGRKRMFLAGTVAFAATSALCGLAPSLPFLAVTRALQGAAAALLVPGSLAILKSSIRREDQDAAVGAWAGLSGVTTAAGPLLGGWLVEALSWRAIFFLNLPLALAAASAGNRCVRTEQRAARTALDWTGGALAAICLAGLVFALIEGPAHGWPLGASLSGALGLAALAAFVAWERRAPEPMLPLSLFRRRQFAAVNLTTLTLYFGLSGALFLVVLGLQHGLGYGPLGSSLALLPISAIMLVLSPLAGRLARAIGYRAPMTVGPVCAGAGLALIAWIGLSGRGLASLAPGVMLFSLGLGLTVAPLTSAAMTGVEDRDAGIATAVNNAVARVAGLLGVAVLPGLGGVSVAMSGEPFLRSVRAALFAAAAVCVAGGLVALVGVPSRRALAGEGALPSRGPGQGPT